MRTFVFSHDVVLVKEHFVEKQERLFEVVVDVWFKMNEKNSRKNTHGCYKKLQKRGQLCFLLVMVIINCGNICESALNETTFLSVGGILFNGTKFVIQKGSGDINIMAVVQLWGENYTLNYETGVLPLMAIDYAIDYLHKKNLKYASMWDARTDLLDRIFGFELILKDVFYQDQNNEYDRTLMSHKVGSWRTHGNAAFIFGPRSSFELLGLETIRLELTSPIFSYGASSIYLDRYSTNVNNEMMSSVPSDTFRIQALIDLLHLYKWLYIGVAHSLGFEGLYEVNSFITKIKYLKICVPAIVNIGAGTKRLGESLKGVSKIERIKVLVLFTNDVDSRTVLAALKRQNLVGRFILLFVYGSANYIEVTRGYEDVADGSMSIDYGTKDPNGFEKWFLKRSPENSPSVHFHLYWEDVFKCRLGSSKVLRKIGPPKRKYYEEVCSGEKHLSRNQGFYSHSLAGRMFKAVEDATYNLQTIIHSKCLEECVDDMCSNWNETCKYKLTKRTIADFYGELLKMMALNRYNTRFTKYFFLDQDKRRRVLYKFDRFHYDLFSYGLYAGQMQARMVGYWKFLIRDKSVKYPITPAEMLKFDKPKWVLRKDLIWKNHTSKFPPTSICSERCQPGYRKEAVYESVKSCCWKCIKCPKNHVLKNNIICKACKFDEAANLYNNTCVPLPEQNMKTHIVLIMVSFCGIGIGLVIFVVCVFIYYNQNHIVRASGRDLCYGILVGVLGLFICPIVYLTKPSGLVCASRDILPCLSFLTCYAALFMKVLRIHRIFTSASLRVARPHFITPRSQVYILISVAVGQICIILMWFINNKPRPEKLVSENELFVTYHCQGSRNYGKYIINLLPTILAQISCTLLAFKTRKYPKDYNEARHIASTLFLTFLYWCVFLPTFSFRNSSDTYFGEYAISFLTCLTAFTTLIGLFGYKLVLLYRKVPPSSTRTRSVSSSDYHREANMNYGVNNLNSPPNTIPNAVH